MTEDPDHLVVYGTLRPGFTNPFAEYLRRHGRYVGEGTFPGLLFDLGAYPGAVYQPHQAATVRGSVYALGLSQGLILTALDDYEGVEPDYGQPAEYVRTVIPVHCRGEVINCWAYLYNYPTDSQQLIESGDYLAHLGW